MQEVNTYKVVELKLSTSFFRWNKKQKSFHTVTNQKFNEKKEINHVKEHKIIYFEFISTVDEATALPILAIIINKH